MRKSKIEKVLRYLELIEKSKYYQHENEQESFNPFYINRVAIHQAMQLRMNNRVNQLLKQTIK
jgi:hypothetical protein